MTSLDKCRVCENDNILGLVVSGKKICIECANKIFIKYQTFVEGPKGIDPSNLDKIEGPAQERKELQSLYAEFRDVLHAYDKLDDVARAVNIPTELMERLYTLGQRIRIANILLADMRSSIENGDTEYFRNTKQKIGDEISFCNKELLACESEMKKFARA